MPKIHCYEFAARRSRTVPFEKSSQRDRVHVVRPPVHIHEIRACACLRNRLGSRDEGIWNRDNCVSRLHPRRYQGEAESIRAIRYTNAMFGFADLCKPSLKILDCTATDETSRIQRAPEHVNQFLLHFFVWSY